MKLVCALSQQRLKELVHYAPESGRFTWVASRGPGKGGAPAGGIGRSGYHRIGIDGVRYQSHRLAWLYMTGRFPSKFIDHCNGNRADNRWANLRECSMAENAQNTTTRADNTSGQTGVYWDRHQKKWRAEIMVNGRRHALGKFLELGEAKRAYAEARLRLHCFQPVQRASSKTAAGSAAIAKATEAA